ncbi:DNA-binding protein [Cupriavidus taiwanensis]|nr:DNA-binding protein [Cupriavidus taiwanensis]
MVVEEKGRRFADAWARLVGENHGSAPEEAQRQVIPNVTVSGGTVFVGNGNVHNVFNVRPKVTVVQTGNGVLDAAQKRRLLELRDQIVGVSRVLEGHQVSPATVMRRLNAHMNVNSYAEIPAELFDRAENYLVRWRGRLEGMPGATKSPGWRDRRIQAIHARCKELNCDRWRLNYMRKVFAKTSLIDLSNEEIGKLYRAVMDRKPEA